MRLPAQRAAHNPAIPDVRRAMEEDVKYKQVMEQVFEPRRLQEAWQQVRSNAGAAGNEPGVVQKAGIIIPRIVCTETTTS